MIGVIIAMLAAAIPAQALPSGSQSHDWLVTLVRATARVVIRKQANEIVLDNGLIRRVFRTVPNFATVSYTNVSNEVEILRGIKPEAVVELNGKKLDVGGLTGQPDYAYLDPSWLAGMKSDPGAFQYLGYTVGTPQPRYPWTRRRHADDLPWPPHGVTLTARFGAPAGSEFTGIEIDVHYALYEGIPVLAKWITIQNAARESVSIESLDCEVLAVTEEQTKRIDLESNYAFFIAGTGPHALNTTNWGPDPDYLTQIDYERLAPLLLTSRYPLGPGVELQPEEQFESFQTYELLQDSYDRERQGLARRRMYRMLAPQVTENPIFMHVRSADPAAVRLAIDQCATVGFEMVILTFGSGANVESEDPAYIAQMKNLAAYAHSRNVEIGAYTLMAASRDVGPESDVIDPKSNKPGSKFGQSACLASAWADGYFRRVLRFYDETGFDVIETDGPYHGDVCASTTHAHHRGLADSQWAQWQACCNFYYECRKRGIYVNTPDWYYMNGSNKCSMGYRETNFSLPRNEQILISRQNIYDGTFDKTPSMGWMFVPLVEYQGGGPSATMEPLADHLADYEWHLAQNFGCGVMAAYRGPRLYDSQETEAVVKKWVEFFKQNRQILESDIIHVKRADGRGVDCMLHVNSQLMERGLAMVFNPTDSSITTSIELPLYYTGLHDTATVRERYGRARVYHLDRSFRIRIQLKMQPRSVTWYTIE